MIDEAFERQSFASVLEQDGAESYAQQMRAADSAQRAIDILKAFAQSRGEVLSVAHEDRPPEQMCTAHMSFGEVSNSMGSQGAAMAAIAAWLDRTAALDDARHSRTLRRSPDGVLATTD